MGRRKRSEHLLPLKAVAPEPFRVPVAKQHLKVATCGLRDRYPDRRARLRPNLDHYGTLPPEWIAGFSAGESDFGIQIAPSHGKKTMFTISPYFRIALSNRDETVLHRIQKTLGVGLTRPRGGTKGKYPGTYSEFKVTGIKQCLSIRDWFVKYPLAGQKEKTFQVWCQALDLLGSGQAETRADFLKLCKLRDKMNSRTKRNVSYKDLNYFKFRLKGQLPFKF